MAEETRKMAFICSKGNLDMAYPALIMSWAALGNGIDVTIFFTFWGLDLITEKRIDHLEISPIGNTSMKMSMMGLPTGNLGIPNWMAIIPGMTAFTSWFMKRKIAEVEAPPIREFMQMLSDAGAKLYGCKMTADMMGLTPDHLIDEAKEIVTASEFIDMTEGAQITFI
ncbi:MAG: DsrE/DsrF/DrsH-like family protein [Anaerolineales bacterium]|jgi:peroxiredoxin family protein